MKAREVTSEISRKCITGKVMAIIIYLPTGAPCENRINVRYEPFSRQKETKN